MKKSILYLGSQSQPRQGLLKQAKIPFKTISHNSDERVDVSKDDFYDYVLAISHHKMESLVLPEHSEETGDTIFVLTADTLIRGVDTKEVFEKPKDRDDAKRMLAELCKQEAEVVTGCCLEKKVWDGTEWQTAEVNQWTCTTLAEFFVEADWVDRYLENTPIAMYAASAAIIEGYGGNFFKSIKGSYSGAIGLPIYDVRKNLIAMGFEF